MQNKRLDASRYGIDVGTGFLTGAQASLPPSVLGQAVWSPGGLRSLEGYTGCRAGLSGLAGLPNDRQPVSLTARKQWGDAPEPGGLGRIFSPGKCP